MEQAIVIAIGTGVLVVSFVVLPGCALATLLLQDLSCNSKDDENKSE